MPKYSNKELNEFRNERIVSLYKEGYTLQEITNEVNLTYARIENILKKEGVLKKKIKFVVIDEALIVKLSKEGKNADEISRELRISHTLIFGVLKKHKLIKEKYSYGGQSFNSQAQLDEYRKQIGIKVVLAYEEGKSVEEIEKLYKVSAFIIKNLITRNKKKV